MKMIKYLMFLGSCYLTLGCNIDTKDTSQVNDIKETRGTSDKIDSNFDSLMENLPKDFPSNSLFKITKGEIYSSAYELVQRRYYPKLLNLTFDSRKFVYINHVKGGIVDHIYNDSIEIVLPFTDINYLVVNDSISDSNYIPFTNLTQRLNHLFDGLNVDNAAVLEEILDALMNLHGLTRIKSEIDYRTYVDKASSFLKEGTFNTSCKLEIEKAMKTVYSEYKSSYTYSSSGVVVCVFNMNNLRINTIKFIGAKCLY